MIPFRVLNEYSIFGLMWKYLIALLPLPLFAQEYEVDTVKIRTLVVDQDSLHADLWFEPEKGLVHGQLDLYVLPLGRTDSIWLDARQSITVEQRPLFNGEAVEWERRQSGIILRPGQSWERGHIQIGFVSRPFKGVYFNGWNDETGHSQKQIFTQGQGIDHRHWLPHVDAQNDKLKTSLSITFDKEYQVLANGTLTGSEEQPGEDKITWHYAMDHPHSSYLIAFAIGKYEEVVTGSSDPLRAHYIYPERVEDTATTYYGNEIIWGFLNKEIGVPYPWSSYRQVPVQDFPHGGMENTTLTIYSDAFLADERSFDDRNYVYVNAHELAHHWFGDYVTVPSAHDFWIHEGFATYYQMEAEKEVFGDEYYAAKWFEALRLVEAAYRSDNFPLRHGRAGSSRFYQMGSLVIRALEYEMGDAKFNMGIERFLNEHAYGMVTTDSLQTSLEEACECDLNYFFRAYVDEPHFVTIHTRTSPDGESLILSQSNVNGNPTGIPLRKVVLRLWKDPENFEDRVISVPEQGELKVEMNPEDYLFIEVDPAMYYPVKRDINMNPEQWVAAAIHGSPGTRHLAMSALKSESWETKEDAISFIFEAGHFTVLDSAVAQVVADQPSRWDEMIVELFDNRKDSKRSVARHVSLVNKKLKSCLEEVLTDGSYNAAFDAFITLINNDPENVSRYLRILEGTEGGGDRIIGLYHAFLTSLVKGNSNAEGLPKLMEYAGPGYPADVRISAWELIAQRGYSGKDFRHIQYLALTSRHRHLRNAAVRVAKQYLEENRDEEIEQIKFVLRDSDPEDIARVERMLDIKLTDE